MGRKVEHPFLELRKQVAQLLASPVVGAAVLVVLSAVAMIAVEGVAAGVAHRRHRRLAGRHVQGAHLSPRVRRLEALQGLWVWLLLPLLLPLLLLRSPGHDAHAALRPLLRLQLVRVPLLRLLLVVHRRHRRRVHADFSEASYAPRPRLRLVRRAY